VIETNAAFGQSIDVRSLVCLTAVTAQFGEAEIIG
jgi:hypothetical protein